MRLYLCNPNCNARLTGELASSVRKLLWPGDTLFTATADNGIGYIGSPDTISQARRYLEGALPRRATQVDAIIVGCFGDLGLAALQRSIGIPLVTLWDAYILAAQSSSARVGIITTSAFWVDRMQHDAARAGLADMTQITTIDIAPASTRDELAAAVNRAMAELAREGVEAIVLGGALFSGLDRSLPTQGLPIIDLNAAAVNFCRTDERFVTP